MKVIIIKEDTLLSEDTLFQFASIIDGVWNLLGAKMSETFSIQFESSQNSEQHTKECVFCNTCNESMDKLAASNKHICVNCLIVKNRSKQIF